ncbi:MAG: CtsR family transcriptional regulator [Peptococcaceae bacterium]|jgi:transcriptional regulator CtsR|nr:CtsR family transcriptional regulator [Peptococcaceae bacterium]
MTTLAKQIENYIKQMIDQSDEGFIDIRRSEMAGLFMCVPSQINYVLETRFSNQQGYLVESRRGGGGFVRIIKLSVEGSENLLAMVNRAEGKQVSQKNGEGLIDRLVEEELLTAREGSFIKAMINGNIFRELRESMPIEEKQTGQDLEEILRGRMLHAVLVNLLRTDF